MGKKVLLVAAAMAAFLPVGGAQAQGFDPRQPCTEILNASDDATLEIVGAWTFGYLAAKHSDARPVDPSNLGVILGNLGSACQPGQSLLDLVGGEPEQNTDAPAVTGPAAGSEAEARTLLMEFFDPNADRAALTASLFPSAQEIRMVYNEPLASSMAQAYAAAFKPGIKFGPKSGQTDLLMYYTTTGRLQAGDPVLDKFPGGYKDVLQYFRADVPIVRFKFVKPGETIGMAFDGLVYVNDHWVIMPKPWRALP